MLNNYNQLLKNLQLLNETFPETKRFLFEKKKNHLSGLTDEEMVELIQRLTIIAAQELEKKRD